MSNAEEHLMHCPTGQFLATILGLGHRINCFSAFDIMKKVYSLQYTYTRLAVRVMPLTM
jgi:hypothetical protein